MLFRSQEMDEEASFAQSDSALPTIDLSHGTPKRNFPAAQPFNIEEQPELEGPLPPEPAATKERIPRNAEKLALLLDPKFGFGVDGDVRYPYRCWTCRREQGKEPGTKLMTCSKCHAVGREVWYCCG